MSNFSGYKTKAFSESQKFFVLDPSTGTPSFVLGSDLVNQITPNSNYVYSESTRTTAQATDYAIGSLVQTAGATSAGDNFAATYLVVASGEGDFPMDNGNELLVIKGDEFLREQLATASTGEGSDLVVKPDTGETVTAELDKRTIYVGSVAELEALSLAEGVNVYLTEGGRAGEFVVKTGTPPSDPQKGIYIVLANGNYAERIGYKYLTPDMFGAVGGGANDDDAIHGMIDLSSVGDLIYIPRDYIASTKMQVKDHQTWVFGGWLKLDDLGTAVITFFSCNSTTGVTLINPLLDADIQNNVDNGGSGQQSTLDTYDVDGLSVIGGHIKSSIHNSLQGSSKRATFTGTKFELSGEHLVYLASGISGPDEPEESGFVFDSCQFINPCINAAQHSEGHFIQIRGLKDVSVVGKTIMRKDINEDPSFCGLFTNSKNIKFSGVSCTGMTSAAIFVDSFCENIKIKDSEFYRTSTEGYQPIRNNSSQKDIFENCYFDKPFIQPSEGSTLYKGCKIIVETDIRSNNPLEFNDCDFILIPSYTSTTIFRVRVSDMIIRNCTLSVGSNTPSNGIAHIDAESGNTIVEGLDFIDWPNSQYAVRLTNSGDNGYSIVNKISLPATVTDANAIVISDGVSICRLSEIICRGTVPAVGAGVTSLEYGNITSAT